MATTTIAITVDETLRDELDDIAPRGQRSALISEALREYLDRRAAEAAAQWHASLTGDDAATLAAFDATP
jgi:metal-responsive CopG/Arc/MetJ family transcriptional regulator